MKYIGAGTKLKKEAEIKVARTALLSIHAATSELSETPFESSQLTVVPCKKQAPEKTNDVEEIARVPKAKKSGQCAPDHALVPTNGVTILQGTEDLNSTAGQNGIKACPLDALVPTDGVADQQGTADVSCSDTI